MSEARSPWQEAPSHPLHVRAPHGARTWEPSVLVSARDVSPGGDAYEPAYPSASFFIIKVTRVHRCLISMIGVNFQNRGTFRLSPSPVGGPRTVGPSLRAHHTPAAGCGDAAAQEYFPGEYANRQALPWKDTNHFIGGRFIKSVAMSSVRPSNTLESWALSLNLTSQVSPQTLGEPHPLPQPRSQEGRSEGRPCAPLLGWPRFVFLTLTPRPPRDWSLGSEPSVVSVLLIFCLAPQVLFGMRVGRLLYHDRC